MCFWLCWVFIAFHGLSLVGASGGHPLFRLQAPDCGGFSGRAQILEHRLSGCGTWAQLLRGLWRLPAPGTEPSHPPSQVVPFQCATREVQDAAAVWIGLMSWKRISRPRVLQKGVNLLRTKSRDSEGHYKCRLSDRPGRAGCGNNRLAQGRAVSLHSLITQFL